MINLKMVDDDGEVLIDSAKIAVCEGGGGQKQMFRNVFVQPKNCKDSAVPVGTSSGVITATGSSSSFGVSDYVELLTVSCTALLGFAIMFHGDDDFASGVSLCCITHSLRGLAQRVRSVDDRSDLPGFNKLLQKNQVLILRHRHKHASLLAHER